MKHPWLAYGLVALISIGAGVAIAGLPDSSSDDAAAISIDTSIAPTTTTTASSTPATDAPTTAAPTTVLPSTTIAPTTTVPPSTSSAPTTTESGPTTSTTMPLPPRASLVVAAANGTTQNGVAAETVDLLTAAGYVGAIALSGEEKTEITFIYYADGFEESAARMATDLGMDPSLIAPLATAPPVTNLPLVQLLVYVGNDRR